MKLFLLTNYTLSRIIIILIQHRRRSSIEHSRMVFVYFSVIELIFIIFTIVIIVFAIIIIVFIIIKFFSSVTIAVVIFGGKNRFSNFFFLYFY